MATFHSPRFKLTRRADGTFQFQKDLNLGLLSFQNSSVPEYSREECCEKVLCSQRQIKRVGVTYWFMSASTSYSKLRDSLAGNYLYSKLRNSLAGNYLYSKLRDSLAGNYLYSKLRDSLAGNYLYS